jgi:membrane protein involved in colicin uptake
MNTNVNNNESGNMEVMNQVIVRLNELKSVKMASISKSKRPAAKFNKEVATYLLDNWDNLEQLKTCQSQMRKDMPHTTCTEIMDMYDERVAELQAELDKANEPEKPAETKAEDKPKAKAKTAGTKKAETKTTKSDKPAKKQAQEKSDNTKKRPGAPKTLKVGDRHKNGKWLWTEYEPGKFDWRTDPAIKAKNAAERAAKSVASKSTTDADKAKPKAQKKAKAASKTKKAAEPKKAPAITIEEMLTRQAPSGLSKAQKNVLGLLKKGYRMTMIGTGVFLQKDDDRKSIELTTVKALIERYKLDAEPTGLWIK